MPTRRTREYASEGTLARMEKALTLVGGSFIAAAKLLDMTPQRFRNIIHSKRGPGQVAPHQAWSAKQETRVLH
jgi:hypothetical protein